MTTSPFDRIAERYRYSSSGVGERIRARVVETIVRSTSAETSIIDVGSGPGEYALDLAAAGLRVTAADVSPAMLAEARRRANERGVTIDTLEWDVGRPLEIDERFKAGLAVSGPLNYAKDPRPFITQIARVIEPGGTIWIGLGRGAQFPRGLRSPRRLLAPLLGRKPLQVDATVGGDRIDLYVWDPVDFTRIIEPWIVVDRIEAIVVATRLPRSFDERLGRVPLLRRLGALSLLHGRVR